MDEKEQISKEMVEYLRNKFGNHRYDYEMSDFNLRSILERKNAPQTFDELDKRARELEAVIRHIHELQEKMER